MTDCIWIASFPKSGNTWTRYLLAQILFDFDMQTDRIDATIPDINNWRGPLRFQHDGAYTLKTHLCYDRLPVSLSLRKAIYLVRHPLDVVVSAAHYMEPDGGDQELLSVYDEFIGFGGSFPAWVSLGFGTIEQNVMSWADAVDKGADILAVRYEDLLTDPVSEVSAIAAFLGVPIDQERCAEIVEQSSFTSMRRLEEKQVSEKTEDMFMIEHGYKPHQNFRFMRAGKAGQYKDLLDQKTIERLLPVCEKILTRFYYTI